MCGTSVGQRGPNRKRTTSASGYEDTSWGGCRDDAYRMIHIEEIERGTLRNEYEPDPELTIKPIRSRLNLDEDDDYRWLRRRARRYALGHLEAIGRLD